MKQKQIKQACTYLCTGICICLVAVLISCNRDGSGTGSGDTATQAYSSPSEEAIIKYRDHTPFTNPGEHEYLYFDLPESYEDICTLIKQQLIHPMEAAEMPEVFGEAQLAEDGAFPTVSDMLRELELRDRNGLTKHREPEDRLLVACYHHALFLASILRHRGVSVRLRAGFARYYEDQVKVRFSHVVCEVWEAESGQWVILDPDRNFVNVSREKFESPSCVWQNYMGKEMPSVQYIGSMGAGVRSYIHSLLLDMSFVLCKERSYWHTPEFIFRKDFQIEKMDEEQIEVINQIADLMDDPDKHLSQLEGLYRENAFLHPHERSIDEYYDMD